MYMVHMDCYMNIIDNYIVILEKALKNVKVDIYK
jgi:arginine deiminase